MKPTPERRLAAAVRRRGLDVPARLLADAHRPIAPLLSDLGAAIGPLLAAAGATAAGHRLADPRLLDAFVADLDATEEGDAGPG